MNQVKKSSIKNVWPAIAITIALFVSCTFMSCSSNNAHGKEKPNLEYSYNVLDTIAKKEVLNYLRNITILGNKIGPDTNQIPKYFTVSYADLIEVMGISVDNLQFDTLKNSYARLYVGLDDASKLHLYFTPVNRNSAVTVVSSTGCIILSNPGSDYMKKGTVAKPDCPEMIARYGGQNSVNKLFTNPDSAIVGKMLVDLNTPCPTTCLAPDNMFINQK